MDEQAIRASALFAELDETHYQAIRAQMLQVDFRRGQVIFEEGESGDRLFIIGAGKVKLGQAASDGRQHLLSVLGPGDILGELALYDPGPRTATATAVASTSLIELSNSSLSLILSEKPGLSQHLLRSLSQRLRQTNASMADLIFADVPGRVAKTLLNFADRFGSPAGAGTRVNHDLTQEELAQLVGATRETVNKALADFASRRWLRLEGRAVVILEPQKLRQRAH